ncbi:hypothetical protein 8G_00015 [Ralstonia phage Hyacinthe]|uniref:Uncharacterized protein n=3 Tax=Rahariannevirus raharianne TaxID=2846050 RepID=A0A7G5BBD0_9CAUD|nr:hypothetical protein KMC43_gp34 [Ralstonia phage Raharianne]QMV32409.1 hypothetical protein U2_00034 [Ralstonia phage Albius]QMV33447.1 hypothetical protein 8G_00015 [Ralstonia phage Hyacinthe]QMV33603.1 hypothetical protein Y2_00034 [Ralstonia phage Raharianne]
MKLVVNVPFGTYKQGDEITDPDIVQQVLASEQSAYVVPVADDTPPKAKSKA